MKESKAIVKIGEIKRGMEIGKVNDGKHIWHACERCGKERWVRFIFGLPESRLCKSCGDGNRGENSHNWKGGRHITSLGYIEIMLQPDDFFFPMTDRYGYVREHRLVMARSLGRYLLKSEPVHHKNGIKNDNRPKNLQLLKCQAEHLQLEREIKILKQRVTILEVDNVLLNTEREENLERT